MASTNDINGYGLEGDRALPSFPKGPFSEGTGSEDKISVQVSWAFGQIDSFPAESAPETLMLESHLRYLGSLCAWCVSPIPPRYWIFAPVITLHRSGANVPCCYATVVLQ